VRKAAASNEAYLTEVIAKDYFDRVALTFGDQQDRTVHSLQSGNDPNEVFVFSNYAWLRETKPAEGKSPGLVARGSFLL
jgi:hypothetical protein